MGGHDAIMGAHHGPNDAAHKNEMKGVWHMLGEAILIGDVAASRHRPRGHVACHVSPRVESPWPDGP